MFLLILSLISLIYILNITLKQNRNLLMIIEGFFLSLIQPKNNYYLNLIIQVFSQLISF